MFDGAVGFAMHNDQTDTGQYRQQCTLVCGRGTGGVDYSRSTKSVYYFFERLGISTEGHIHLKAFLAKVRFIYCCI